MKKLKKELEVDFIGGQGELTKEEEKAISDFIKKKKSKQITHHKKPKKAA
jgi:hypothetical protein